MNTPVVINGETYRPITDPIFSGGFNGSGPRQGNGHAPKTSSAASCANQQLRG